jgi:PKD repeat protein
MKSRLLALAILSMGLLALAAGCIKVRPVASFIRTPSSGDSPLEVDFDASDSFDRDGWIVAYDWDFGDNTTGSGEYISHTFSSSSDREFRIRLTVTDNDGKTGSTTRTVTVGTDGLVRIASWNVLKLGADTPVADRAAVIAEYDLVALQEVKSLDGVQALRDELQNQTEVAWQYVASALTGSGNAAEYYVFVYRTDRVQEIEGPRGLYPEPDGDDFVHEPFFATFRAGEFDFTIITVHVVWGDGSAPPRVAEVQKLDDVWVYVQSLDPDEDDLLLTGDYNLNRPTHYAFDDLRALDLIPLIENGDTFTTYSTSETKIGANWYDNLWMDPNQTSDEYTGSSGVDYLHTRFYQSEPFPHLKVRKEISDHCPVWAEFRTGQTVPEPAPEPDGEISSEGCGVSDSLSGMELLYNNSVSNDWSLSVVVEGVRARSVSSHRG